MKRSNRRRGRLAAAGSAVLLVLAVTAFVFGTVDAQGLPVQHASLNDGGIWVTSDSYGLFGRLNKPAGVLDAAFNPPGGAQQNYQVDTLQQGSAALAWDKSSGKLYPVNTGEAMAQSDQGVSVSSADQAEMAGSTVAVLDPTTGEVRAERFDPDGSIGALPQLDSSSAPLAKLGRSASPSGASLAVGQDGTVYAVAANGKVATITPNSDGGFAPAQYSNLGRAVSAPHATAVGGQLVVLDAATGTLIVPGGPTVTVPGADPHSVLQQPGPAAGDVVMATSRALLSVDLSSGSVSTLSDIGRGAPAEPVSLDGCVYGAWAATHDGYVSACGGAPAKVGGLSDLQELVDPVFRVNRDEIVLNDLSTGGVWDLADTREVDDWSSVEPAAAPTPGKSSQATVQQQSSTASPKAVDETLGARPGRTTVLHVLDADSDPSGAILSVEAVSAPDNAAAHLQISPDGQTVEIALPAGVGAAPIHFQYTIDDGKGLSASATVTVDVRTADENAEPTLRTGYQARTWTVPSGGALAVPMLQDWRDFDGDPLALTGATAAAGSAAATSDGLIEYTAPVAGGLQTIHYQLSDGIGAPVGGTLSVMVQSPTATHAVAPVAEPDVARGEVGQPIVLHPLDNDLPGSDPQDPGAVLALAAPLAQPAGTSVTTDLADGSATVVPSRPGTILLSYTDKFGDAPFATGTIRVDVTADPQNPLPPVTVPVTAVLHGQEPTTVDVLASDFDPSGALLVVQQAAAAGADSGLQVGVVDGRWLRISAQSPTISPNPQVVNYTVTDGITGPVTGQVSVTQLAAPAVDTPIPVDDYATVRTGATVSTAVLNNDIDLAGAPLSLAADVPGAPAPGQLRVLSSAGIASPANGSAFVTGDTVTYVAPTAVTTPVTETVEYMAVNPSGGQAIGHLHITVNPAPSTADPDQAPQPPPVQERTVAGDTVVIPISTTGVDPDGDPVTLAGIESAPTLGRVLAMNATSLTYQAYPTSSGTDTFKYQVTDTYGAAGQSTISVAVVPPTAPQAPVAVNEDVTAAPGGVVSVNVLADAVAAPDDTLTVMPLGPLNPGPPAGVSLASPTSPISATAPALTGKPLVITYGIADGLGQTSVATVTVHSQAGYENPPVADVAYAAPLAGQSTVTVNALSHVSDTEGSSAHLTITHVDDALAKSAGGNITIPVTAKAQTVSYEVRDSSGATTIGLIYVSAPGSGAPYAKAGAQISVAKNGSTTVALSADVVDPAGKPVRLTTTNEMWAAPSADVRVANNGDTSLTVTAEAGYTGPASVTFQVTDGTTLTDPHGLYAVITIPVQVGPATPVLRCPSDPVSVIEGGNPLSLDVTSLCHVWTADPGGASSLKYTAQWRTTPAAVTVGGTGTSTLSVTAGASAAPGSTGTLLIGVAGSSAIASPLNVQVAAAADPTVAPISVDGIEAGQTAVVDVAPYITSQLRDPSDSVVTVSQTSGMAATSSHSGATVKITPGAASHGRMTFSVLVSDVTPNSRPDQRAVGQITLNVLGVPGAPGTPVAGGTVLSDSVQLSWTEPPDNGAPIEQYQVTYNGGSQTCPASPCTITGLHNGTAYTFTVKAQNLVGWSKPSGQSEPATPNTVPGAVTGLAVSDPQNGTLDITWDAAPDLGTPVLDYDVTWSGGGNETVTGTSLTATGLDNDTVNTFTVIAINKQGPGPSASVPGESAGAPAAPGAPTVTQTNPTDKSSHSVSVLWNPVDPNGPGSTMYTVTRTGGGGGTKVVCQNYSLATNCPDDGLANDGTIYTYTVTAANADAATDAADHTSPPSPGTQMEATDQPDPITNVSAAPTGTSEQATVTFDAPASYGSESIVTCTYNGANCGTWNLPVDGESGVTETVNGLPDGSPAQVSLQDCNGESSSLNTEPCDGSVSTPDITTYGPINGLSINPSASGQTVNFSISVNPDGKSATVQINTSRQSQTFTTGVGEWSWSSSDNMGYSATDTISVTVSDPGRATVSGSQQATTPPPPPPPTVTVSAGSKCGSACSKYCTDPSCAYIHVQTANFGGTVTCTFDSQDGNSGWIQTDTWGANDSHDSVNYFGFPGEWVTATCGGVTSAKYSWP